MRYRTALWVEILPATNSNGYVNGVRIGKVYKRDPARIAGERPLVLKVRLMIDEAFIAPEVVVTADAPADGIVAE